MAELSVAIGRFEYNTGVGSNLTGTASSSGVTVTGTTTVFNTELRTGDAIRDSTGTEFRTVETIASATSLTIDSAFTVALSGATLVPATFTEVVQVSSLDGTSQARDNVEVSNWSSGAYKKYVQGRIEPGSAQLEMFFDPKLAAHIALIAELRSGAIHTWRAWVFDSAAGTAIPDDSNSLMAFRGYLEDMPTNFPNAGALGGTLAVKITGPISWAAGIDP